MKTDNHFTMRFTTSAYNNIIDTIGSQPAELGGLLFGNEEDCIVRKFVFDKNATVTRATYSFNVAYLNKEIKRLWEDEALSCIGFIHSHPRDFGRPSFPDIQYFTEMFQYMPRKLYLIPIVYTVPDGGFDLRPYILRKGKSQPECVDKIELLFDSLQDKPNGLSVVKKECTNAAKKTEDKQSSSKKVSQDDNTQKTDAEQKVKVQEKGSTPPPDSDSKNENVQNIHPESCI
jgi:proteasome lid subunit RPN8/RPN11